MTTNDAGSEGAWDTKRGKIGLHPAYDPETKKIIPSKMRFIGAVPAGTWPFGFKGFVAPMGGRLPGECLFYLFPEHYLERWLKNNPSRRHENVRPFAVQRTLSWSSYVPVKSLIAQAMRLRSGWSEVGRTTTDFRVLRNGDSMTIRVPQPGEWREYNSTHDKDERQGALS